MVGIIHDSRALQALLQKYRDLPSRLSANTKQKAHQFVKVGIFQNHLRWSLYKSKSKQKSWFRRNVHRGVWRCLATLSWGADFIEKWHDKHAVTVFCKSLIKYAKKFNSKTCHLYSLDETKSIQRFSTARFLHYKLGRRATAHQLTDFRGRLVGTKKSKSQNIKTQRCFLLIWLPCLLLFIKTKCKELIKRKA